jgi:hypothetical protein
LDNELKSTLDNLEEDELLILKKIIRGNKLKDGNLIKNLADRGILRFSGAFAQINGNYFCDFLKQKFSIEDNKTTQVVSTQLLHTTNRIFSLIERININYKNKNKGDYLFEPITIEDSHRKTLSSYCADRKDFIEFINVVYTTLYERTSKGGNKKARLPLPYNTDPIINRIDALRQEYHHITVSREYRKKQNEMPRGELFKHYLGNELEPTAEQFVDIQVKVLDEFDGILNKILSTLSG